MLKNTVRRLIKPSPEVVEMEIGCLPASATFHTATPRTVDRFALPLDELLDWPIVQVISPGRSGTRWLADLLVAVSPAAVIHASSVTLAELGYRYSSHEIGGAEAYGAYLQSRIHFIRSARINARTLVDLDCKNSPMGVVLSSKIPSMKFLVQLREPLEFIASGVARGYFVNKDPAQWGHILDRGRFNREEDEVTSKSLAQMLRIARFWGSIAQVGQTLYVEQPQRTRVADVARLFDSRSYTQSTLSDLGLEIPLRRISDYDAFMQPKNTNRRTLPKVPREWQSQLYEAAFDGLSLEFLSQAGLRSWENR